MLNVLREGEGFEINSLREKQAGVTNHVDTL